MRTDPPVTRGPRPAPGWRRRAAAAAVAAAAVIALTGCSADRLGAAAVVDGEAISTDELQVLAREYADTVPGQPPGRVQLSVLQQLIVNRVFEAIAREHRIHVRDGRIATELDRVVAQVGGRKALVRALSSQQRQVVPASQLETWMKDRLVFDALARRLAGTATGAQPSDAAYDKANRELTRYAAAMDIEVNPRYGTWNPDSGISPLVSGGLSRTVEELSGGSS